MSKLPATIGFASTIIVKFAKNKPKQFGFSNKHKTSTYFNWTQ